MPTRLRTRPRAALLAVAFAAAFVASACLPPPEPPPGWSQVYITRDAADVTKITSSSAGSADVNAPANNTGGNSRTLFWRHDAPISRNHTACVTTSNSDLMNQEGVALRVAPSPHGGTRGITVNKNVWMRADHIYNVMLWDTSPGQQNGMRGFFQLSGKDMSAAFDTKSDKSPRRLCARAVGRTVEWKVWQANKPEPAWGTPGASGSSTLPASYDYDGQPGLYIGHTPPGGWASFKDFTVAK